MKKLITQVLVEDQCFSVEKVYKKYTVLSHFIVGLQYVKELNLRLCLIHNTGLCGR